MSAPKPTPGPWSVAHSFRPGAQFTIHATIGKSTPFVVAETACIHKTWGDERANAELIASAPDLASRIACLDALLAVKQRQCDMLTDALDAEVNKNVRLRNALKATLQDLEHTARPELHDDPAWAGRDSRKLAIATLAEGRTE